MADKLSALHDNKNFQDTYGKWITQGVEHSRIKLAQARGLEDMARAQGEYSAFLSLVLMAEQVFTSAKSAKNKRRKMMEADDNERK